MINEMKQLDGHVVFGGPVSYGQSRVPLPSTYHRCNRTRRVGMLIRYTVPQHAWVQSGTIRENITFSSKPEDVDLDRVNEVIEACALRPEVDMWPDGDQ